MIYRPPTLDADDHAVLGLIERQRERLRVYTSQSPRRWIGSLRRTTFARAIRGSNSIEGYLASMDEALAAVDDDPPMDERTETWLAIKGYRDAMTYIMQAAQDPFFEFGKQFLKSLHFMMLGHDMSKSPGQWRPGSVFVISAQTGETVYEAPPSEMVDDLMRDLVADLAAKDGVPSLVKAAMAHLNLTMMHPFRGGNGRMARALQTLVLARGGALHPVFASIEEWLGRNTQAYYDVLAATGEGRWSPDRETGPWVRFCMRAHYQQAATLLRRNEEYERLFDLIQGLVTDRGLHDRVALPLFDAALGLSLTNLRYRTETQLTDAVASRDLKKLSDQGLLTAIGEKRGRTYAAGRVLRALRDSVRTRWAQADPYEVVRQRQTVSEPRLPGM